MSYSLILIGLAFANLLGIISPGPAFLLVSRAAASRSRTVGLATAFGVAGATTLWAVAATFGVAAVMTRFATVYGLVQLAGGAYLIWLGLSAWREQGSAPSAPRLGDASAREALSATPLRRAFLTGLSLTLTNPKVVIFFSSIFVALLPAQAPLWVRLTALAIVAVQETAWYVLVACLFSHARMQAGYQRLKGSIDRVMGAVFIAFGARIVALARI